MLDVMGFRNRLAAFLGFSHGGARNLYQVFGYDREPTVADLYAIYLRNDVASRIVRAFPQATWREIPVIRDEAGDSAEKDSESYSPFTESAENFFEENKVLHYLERADRLASIGRFGVLVMGFQDGKVASEPLTKGKHKLLYMSPYIETGVQVSTWETNPTSPRFGLPLLYNVNTGSVLGATGGPSKAMQVHYSRVIHISEFLDDNDTFGVPRLLPILNRLKDLEKVVGGSAETFWLNANRGLALWADKDVNLGEEGVAEIKKQADEFQHQLRRHLVGSGMSAQVLGSDTPDPKPNVETLLDLIAGAVGIPKRILIGSERGELSSAQDENNWAARIDERRKHYAGPMILRRLVQMLIDTENLPKPKGKWWTDWEETDTQNPLEAANIAVAKSSALANYSNAPDAQYIVPVQEFRRDILGLPPESEYAVPEEPEPLPEDEPVEDRIFADDEALGIHSNGRK
jgi:hypothetical protein